MLLSPGSQQKQQLQETVPAQAQTVSNGGSGARVAPITYKRPRVSKVLKWQETMETYYPYSSSLMRRLLTGHQCHAHPYQSSLMMNYLQNLTLTKNQICLGVSENQMCLGVSEN